MHVALRTWIGKLNFSITPMDDIKIVLGMQFLDQVHAFLLLASNSLNILDGSKGFTVPIKHDKSKDKMLSAMQFIRDFKKDPSFLVSIR